MVEDLEIIDLSALDFEFAPPCEGECTALAQGKDGPCENEADYVCSLQCCQFKILLCRDCLDLLRLAFATVEGREFACNFCNVPFVMTMNHIKVVDTLP